MRWITDLLTNEQSIATTILVLALTMVAGLLLGQIKFRGIQLGVAGVLFSGLFLGHLGLKVEPHALTFIREFGLVIFIYAVGLAVGPGFFNTFRLYGLRTNLMAISIVLLGTFFASLACWVGKLSPAIAVGVLSGATTNTPSLGAANQVLHESPPDAQACRTALQQAGIDVAAMTDQQWVEQVNQLPGLGCAVTYPFGVIGNILVFLMLGWLFRIDAVKEARDLEKQLDVKVLPLERCTIQITCPDFCGKSIAEVMELSNSTVVISRIQRHGKTVVAQAEDILGKDDIILAVGARHELDQLTRLVGKRIEHTSEDQTSGIEARWVLISKPKMVGIPLEQLNLGRQFHVQLTRIRRGETELPPNADLRLSMGDSLLVVGMPECVARISRHAGDAPKQLEKPHLLPVFVGIGLGVIIGSIPIFIPGLSSPIKIGLAGGPLIIALILSHLQRVGPLVFHLPRAAGTSFKELGIAMFLAAVGLEGGSTFITTITHGDGMWWMLWGIIITLAPLLLISAIAYRCMKAPYPAIIGVMSGSMTNPPALAFANTLTRSEIPGIAYATVYPVTMILRVVIAQIFVLF
ncbi:MAG: putative transporter [Planctomycetia bacterium]|nr:putative transporter [Planctomycetia bacterium]